MDADAYLRSLRAAAPLVHNMTNQVVANFVANGLLALGASPIMAYAEEESAEITAICHATALNIGTLTSPVFHSMLLAGRSANEHGHPLVLDPVGVGASDYRQKSIERLLSTTEMTLIRGNAGEIATLCGIQWAAKGVDSGDGQYDLKQLAMEAAQRFNCLIAISGQTDWISDGQRVIGVENGQPLMTTVTGMGCLLTAVCAAFLSVDNSLESVAMAHALYGIAGDKAFEQSPLPGSFQMHFLDQLYALSGIDQARIKMIQ
ncbi:hydroxyethylthiazole kinase [Wohlfahrtiimonas chitiniclastica]|uniref:hydroxyethylthiazole kinase n=1 Tax=Wohlfahrtiimonas chitiniclastica TaxID=400946 RepID=UPI001BCD6279|nr:hydroxyethylthiazole kinase [Wohlfahrtiimonas chitiniclastica]MBS7834865.1 hydroxyethylthiazole kinase [Wohlfahrtiimonas chitiniclastica]